MAKKKDTIALLAHSASGKSALLLCLGIERYHHDMDVFMQRNKTLSAMDAFRTMLPECRGLLSVRNDAAFLRELKSARERGEFENVEFIYLKRPQPVIYANFCGVNADGLNHRPISEARHVEGYSRADALFRMAADQVVEYPGHSLDEMGILLRRFAREILGANWDLDHLHQLLCRPHLSPEQERSRFLWNLDLPHPAPRVRRPAEDLIAGWVFHREGLHAGRVKVALRANSRKSVFPLSEVRKDVLSMLKAHGHLTAAEAAELPRLGFRINVQKAFGIPLKAPVNWELGFVEGGRTTWVSTVRAAQ